MDPRDILNNFYFHVIVYVTIAHFSLSHSLTLDMLNNFCFHVYAQKSLFIGENVNEFFLTTPPSPVTFEFIELVPS